LRIETWSSGEYLASAAGRLSLHVHFLHFIQRSARTIRQADKLPSTTTSTLPSRTHFLNREIPPLLRAAPAILVAFHLSCHLYASKIISVGICRQKLRSKSHGGPAKGLNKGALFVLHSLVSACKTTMWPFNEKILVGSLVTQCDSLPPNRGPVLGTQWTS